MGEIFGYSFDEIKAAQQGGRLGRVIDTTKTPPDDKERLDADVRLLEQYGEKKLRSMGYMGVIDRLERAGRIISNA